MHRRQLRARAEGSWD